MKSKLLWLLLVTLLAGCWTTRKAIQGGVEALLVNPAGAKPAAMAPPLPPARAPALPRLPPKPYTNIFLVWTNPSPLNSFQVYSRTSLQAGSWKLRTNYTPSLSGELRVKFTNNMAQEYFKVWWTNLSFGKGGWM